MARKEITIDIQDRDQLLTFKIRQMSVMQLESWGTRVIMLLAAAGAKVPEGYDLKAAITFLKENSGAMLGNLGNMDYERARPLLDELLSCCSIKIGNLEKRCTPEVVDDHVQDVKTLLTLRKEALVLNVGFIKPEEEGPSGSPEKPNTETP
jgi:hypothetical protein